MNQVYNIIDQLNDYLTQYKLSMMLLLTLFVFVISGDALRQIDITAAPIDLGVLAVLPLSIITVILFMMLTQWMIAWQWPILHDFQLNFLHKTFKSLLAWQKAFIYFSFYLAVLFSFIMVLIAFI